jgi:hypothetical protein
MNPWQLPQAKPKPSVVICCQPSWVLLPPYFNLLTGGSMNTYHITVVYKTREYFRVEANNEEEAKERVLGGEVELYNWDQGYQRSEVETIVG